MSKILLCGDLHMRPELRYSEYIKNGRTEEVKNVLDTIVKAGKDCEKICLLGDNFDTRTNSNQVIKNFTSFIERFEGKEVFIISGNHDANALKETAIDYLREVKNKKWHIITKEIFCHENLVFCPYFFRQELGCNNYEEATQLLMEQLKKYGGEDKCLMIHHAVSDTLTVSGSSTNLFPEIVLPKKELEKYYEKIVTGHIHLAGTYGKTLVAGSIFTNEAGEVSKEVFKLNEEMGTVESIPLPVRPILNLKNPTLTEIQECSLPYAIVKCTFTEKSETPIEKFKEELKRFDAYILVENYPSERKKMDMEGATMEFDILSLLTIYAETKKIDKAKLLSAWEEISA